jgi:hypothetical protein
MRIQKQKPSRKIISSMSRCAARTRPSRGSDRVFDLRHEHALEQPIQYALEYNRYTGKCVVGGEVLRNCWAAQLALETSSARSSS